eukprot:5623566-Lingulodinium_polyedra.AAC.1
MAPANSSSGFYNTLLGARVANEGRPSPGYAAAWRHALTAPSEILLPTRWAVEIAGALPV